MTNSEKMENEIRKAIESLEPVDLVTLFVEGNYNRDKKASAKVSKARRDWLNAVSMFEETDPFTQICSPPPKMPKVKKSNLKKKS